MANWLPWRDGEPEFPEYPTPLVAGQLFPHGQVTL